MKDIVTSLDLEMNQPSGKIIQIGAVVGNFKTGEVLDKLSIIINPHEPINPYITNLTGITDDAIFDEGTDLLKGYELLSTMHQKCQAFINPITWGGGDSQELYKQLTQMFVIDNWCFGRRWLDVKTLFIALRAGQDLPTQGGLAKSMTKFGLKFEGRKHNALDDAHNTFRFFCKLMQELKRP